jgi:hypothetical protein
MFSLFLLVYYFKCNYDVKLFDKGETIRLRSGFMTLYLYGVLTRVKINGNTKGHNVFR